MPELESSGKRGLRRAARAETDEKWKYKEGQKRGIMMKRRGMRRGRMGEKGRENDRDKGE